MRTVQLTLDEPLVDEVDKAAKAQGKSRSAFTRAALRDALAALRVEELEARHREGYRRHPVDPEELSDWEGEQVWPD